MTREEFVRRCHDIKEGWLDRFFDEKISKAIDRGAINLDKVPDHYGAVYPLLGAIFEDMARQCIYGGSDETSRKMRKQANKIKPFLHG